MLSSNVVTALVVAIAATPAAISCGFDRSKTPALAESQQTSSEAVATRIRQTVANPNSVSYDGLLNDRIRLLAISDDPDLCTHLLHGQGAAGSSTVFAMFGGPVKDQQGPTKQYAAQRDLQRVVGAAMGSGSGPVAIFTTQLLDDACRLVKPDNANDVAAILDQGTLHAAQTKASPCVGSFEGILQIDQQPLQARFKAAPCNGLLQAIEDIMPLGQAQAGHATALRCVGAP